MWSHRLFTPSRELHSRSYSPSCALRQSWFKNYNVKSPWNFLYSLITSSSWLFSFYDFFLWLIYHDSSHFMRTISSWLIHIFNNPFRVFPELSLFSLRSVLLVHSHFLLLISFMSLVIAGYLFTFLKKGLGWDGGMLAQPLPASPLSKRSEYID